MPLAFPPTDSGFCVFIDEAGDAGTKLLHPGRIPSRSDWFILGAVVLRVDNKSLIQEWCDTIKSNCDIPQSQELHFRLLDRPNKEIACHALAKLPVRLFAFCSHKGNMRGYHNERAALVSSEKHWFYNSCIKYLLERITEFCEAESLLRWNRIRHAEICLDRIEMVRPNRTLIYLFEEKRRIEAGLNYHPIRPMKTDVLHPSLIRFGHAKDEPGLQLADIVAGAFWAAVNRVEARNGVLYHREPARALKPRMWKGIEGKSYKDNGVTLFPPSMKERGAISIQQRRIFVDFGYSFPSVR